MRLRDRIVALERDSRSKFRGYACVRLYGDQTASEAVASWEAENGPVEARQVILWRWPGKKEQPQCA